MTAARRGGALDILALVSSTSVCRALAILTSLWSLRILGPEGIGEWKAVFLALSYLMAASTGVTDGSQPAISAAAGRGDEAAERRARDQMFTVAGLEGLILGGALSAWALAGAGGADPGLRTGFALGLPLLLLWKMVDCSIVAYRLKHRFVFLGLSDVAFGAFDLAAMIALTLSFGLYGQFAAFGLSYASRVALYALRAPANGISLPRPTLDLTETWRLMQVGLPLMAAGLLLRAVMTLDSVFVVRSLGTAALGYYAVGTMAQMGLMAVPNALSSVFQPRLFESFGAAGKTQGMREELLKGVKLLAYALCPLCVAGAYFFVPVLVRHALPKYELGLPVLGTLVLSVLVSPLVHLPTHVFTAAGRLGESLLIHAVAAAGLAVALFFTAPLGVQAAAWTAVAAQCLLVVLLVGVGFSYVVPRAEAWGHAARLAAAAVWAGAAIRGADALLPSWGPGLSADVMRAAAGCALSLAVCSPLFYAAYRHLDREKYGALAARLLGPFGRA